MPGSRRDDRGAQADPVTVCCRAIKEGARLPRRMTSGSSGWDLHACLEGPLTLGTHEWAAVPTGLVLAIPAGLEGVVRPRSGLARRHGIGLLNSPGTIDSDYRGEVQVILMNWGPEPFELRHGDRIAQIVFQRVTPVAVRWGVVDDRTERGGGGFGHTGLGRETEE